MRPVQFCLIFLLDTTTVTTTRTILVMQACKFEYISISIIRHQTAHQIEKGRSGPCLQCEKIKTFTNAFLAKMNYPILISKSSH